MLVNDLIQSRQFDPLQQQKMKSASGNSASGETFAATLSEFVQDVNSSQAQAGEAAEKMIKGEPVDIHDVMIASEKAKTSFQLLLELRNKAVDMYREALRVQI